MKYRAVKKARFWIAATNRKVARNTTRYIRSLRKQPVGYFIPAAVMLLLPAVVLGPLYVRGFILHYDMVFAPEASWNLQQIRDGSWLYQSLPLTAVLKILTIVLPMDIIQKLVLTAIFSLSALAIYKTAPVQSRAARLFAGSLYAVNPLTYDRLMAGHWRFLLAYSLTPFVVRAIYRLIRLPNQHALAAAVAWWTAGVLISSHHMIIFGVLTAALCLAGSRTKKSFLYMGCLLLGVLAVNSWWIIPALAAGTADGAAADQYSAFASQADPLYGLWYQLLTLQGFWYDGWQNIRTQNSFGPWLVLAALMPVLTGLGTIARLDTTNKRLAAGLLCAGLLGVVLAAGPYPAVSGLNRWIFTTIPGMAAMREPQKFIALLALAYAILAAIGLDTALRAYRKQTLLAMTLCVAAGIFLMRPMLWGVNGQLGTIHYPESWYRFKSTLRQDASAKAVVLPWELYTNKTFTGNLVANPAQEFFGGRAIVSQNMRLPGVPDAAPYRYEAIGTAVQNRDPVALQAAAEKLGAQYVILTEKDVAGQYGWLVNSTQSKVVDNTSDLVVILLTKR